MRQRPRLAYLLVVTILSIALPAVVFGGVEGAAPAGAESSAPTLADLSWLAGTWRSAEGESASTEEVWLEPEGGLMLGLHRQIGDSGSAWFEYLRIVEEEAGIVYVASPGGKGETRFALAELSPGLAAFENPEHDFPQRIEYALEGVLATERRSAYDCLALLAKSDREVESAAETDEPGPDREIWVRVRAEGTVEGQLRRSEWRWRRTSASP